MRRRFLMILMVLGMVSILLAPSAYLQSRKAAPNFNFTDVAGKQYSLNSVKGKVTIVDMWATWCGPCKKEIPSFVKLQKQYGDKLAIIGVSYDDEQNTVTDFLKKDDVGKQINYPIVFGTNTNHPFGQPEIMPTTIFIDKKGNIRKEHNGFMTFEELSALVEKMMAE